MKFGILLLFLLLIGCEDKPKVLPTKADIENKAIKRAESELSDGSEKIALISIQKKIPSDSVYLILRDYFSKTKFTDNAKFIERVIDTISTTRGMKREIIASIIMNYNYEMITEDDIINSFIEEEQMYLEIEDQY